MSILDGFMPDLVKTVVEDIFGKTVTYTQVGNTSYSTSTLNVSTAKTVHTIKIVPPYKDMQAWDEGTTTEGGMRKVAIAKNSISFTPSVVDFLTIDGEQFQVKSIEEVSGGDNLILYILEVLKQ